MTNESSTEQGQRRGRMADAQRGRGSAGERSGGGDSSGDENDDQNRGEERTSPWEWVAAAIGALLVAGAVGFMVYKAVRRPNEALPAITVQVNSVARSGDGYLVQFTVANTGSATAAGVVIEGTLKADTGTVQKSNTTIDYVPGESKRKGGLFFRENPASYQLEVRPLGYDRP